MGLMVEMVERVVECRRRKGLTQAELAGLVGLSIPTIIRIEQGASDPKSKDLSRLADVLDVSVAYLMGEDIAGADCARHPVPDDLSETDRQTSPYRLSYWGGVVDNARDAAARLDRDEIVEIYGMLNKAMAPIEGAYRAIGAGQQIVLQSVAGEGSA